MWTPTFPVSYHWQDESKSEKLSGPRNHEHSGLRNSLIQYHRDTGSCPASSNQVVITVTIQVSQDNGGRAFDDAESKMRGECPIAVVEQDGYIVTAVVCQRQVVIAVTIQMTS